MAFHWKAILLTMLIWKLDFGLWFWGSNLSNLGSFLVPNVSFQIYCLAIQNISFKKWFNTALIKILIKLEMFFHYFFFQYLLSFIIYVGCRSGFWSEKIQMEDLGASILYSLKNCILRRTKICTSSSTQKHCNSRHQ